jgi:cbb3-type cytochrome oxidase maturation protein
MTVLVYLVPAALALGLTGLAAFLWSLSNGQYDDVEGAAVRILENDDIDPGATLDLGPNSSAPNPKFAHNVPRVRSRTSGSKGH